MNIVVDDLRHGKISNPEQFAYELTPLVITGLVSPDLATLYLYLYDNSGTLFAKSSLFTLVGSTWTGTIDARTLLVKNAFIGKTPAYRLPVYAILSDAHRLWMGQQAELANNPPAGSAPPAPDPEFVYLTTSDFNDVAIPDVNAPIDTQFDTIRALVRILRGE